MAMKMDRRMFLKTAAAAALAVSVSGVLTGCSGNDAVNAAVIGLGEFEVTVTPDMTIKGSEVVGQDGHSYVFQPNVKIKYKGNGFSGAYFRDVFSASIGEEKTKLQSGGTLIAAADLPLAGSKTYTPRFEVSSDAHTAFKQGTAFCMKVTLQGRSAEFSLTSAGTVSVKAV